MAALVPLPHAALGPSSAAFRTRAALLICWFTHKASLQIKVPSPPLRLHLSTP